MKSIYSKLLLTSLLLLTVSTSVSARECVECKKSNAAAKKATIQSKAAVCKRAQSTAELNINNVRALINGYGNMWYDGLVAQYHLPKNSNTCPLFCAALWIGGTDVNDQLRIAALRFGSDGDDYWPGPLRINGTASVDLPICNAYDKHWVITKAEVLAHRARFEYGENGQAPVDLNPGADIPDVILNWPASADANDQYLTHYLAPFFDADGDGEYNPAVGDYPYYDFDNELCPRTLKAANPNANYIPAPTMETQFYDSTTIRGGIMHDQVLKGDQTIWWVFNDKGNTHTESKGEAIGLEIRAQAFAFSTNDEINNMTFYSYEIINRSSYELRETYFSQWVDPDLGSPSDDFIGCDVRRGLGYCYNGRPQDTPGSSSYSGLPPAVGIDFFQGPYMDPDGRDNPKIDIDKIRSASYTNQQVKNLLENYRRDINGVVRYDTIAISDDADLFFALDPMSWYFVPGDAVGNCAINGVNFGNNIIDDERFGMRRFVYYDNSLNAIYGEPTKASDYYNYLRGYWMNGQRMKYGGNAVSTGTTNLDCDFMFPDDSDPWHWGTDGNVPEINPDDWREITAGNSPGDRRFMQSAGPFTLKPGALNYITVGIPFAQASSGEGQWASVAQLRQIDDICQALFENCFKVLDGPDAPTITAQELKNEVILYLSYEDKSSNNYNEKYREIDPAIARSFTDVDGSTRLYDSVARSYIFEGYQIYQLKDANTSIADINDPEKARLVAQCDVENYYDTLIITLSSYSLDDNGDTIYNYDTTRNSSPSLPIGTLVNYTTNSATGLISPQVMVQGANRGIQHVFRITNDAFSTSSNTGLVNNKEYYFIAIAYAQNRYKEYSQTEPSLLDGQKVPYLAGRKDERGRSITPITVIPHDPISEDGGKIAQSSFGMSPNVIRIEGYGNGTANGLRLSQQSIEELMGAPGVEGKAPGTYVYNYDSHGSIGHPAGDYSYVSNPCMLAHPQYLENYGPLNVTVIDPLKLRQGRFNILFWNIDHNSQGNIINNDTIGGGVNKNTRWCIVNADGGPVYDSVDTVWSHFSISRYNEQIFPELGVAVSLLNPEPAASSIDISGYKNSDGSAKTNFFVSRYYQGFVKEGALLGSSMRFADENQQWLFGIPDNDSYLTYNWIRSGSQFAAASYQSFISPTTAYNINEPYLDEDYFKAFKTMPYSRTSYIDSSEGIDKTQVYEGVVNGLWAPYGLVSTMPFHPGFSFASFITDDQQMLDELGVNRNQLERLLMTNVYNKALNYNELSKLPSVHIVITADQSKWTRCPVIEMCDDYTQSEGNARRFMMRRHASVDKDGRTCDSLGVAPDVNDPTNPAYISETGMGWFPGYAINTLTGERLNIMFGEDSRYVQYNGRDMMWNPASVDVEGSQNYIMGGRHFIYVMNSTRQTFYDMARANQADVNYYNTYVTPSYDAGRWAVQMLSSAERMMNSPLYPSAGTKMLYKGIVYRADNNVPQRDSIAMLYASTAWVNIPLVNERYAFTNPKDIPCDVTIDIDIRTPYSKNSAINGTDASRLGFQAINRNMPAYQFVIGPDDAVLENVATATNARKSMVDSLLGLINVVPNPYYSYSSYETGSQLETKVRITNLPTGVDANGKAQGCTIHIYTVDGTLVRTLGPTPVNQTTVDWDLHNHRGFPIAGGMYLIHVKVPGIGERVIKWFGTMRPVDLDSFVF